MNTAYFTCTCCCQPYPLRFQVAAVDGSDDQHMCGPCIEHRGADDRKRRERAEHHESLWRQRCEHARLAATKMQDEKDRAFKSRDRAVRTLDTIRSCHELQGTRGVCKCGVKNCRTLRLVENSWLVDRIDRLRQREYEQQREAAYERYDDMRRAAYDLDDEGDLWEPFGINPSRENTAKPDAS